MREGVKALTSYPGADPRPLMLSVCFWTSKSLKVSFSLRAVEPPSKKHAIKVSSQPVGSKSLVGAKSIHSIIAWSSAGGAAISEQGSAPQPASTSVRWRLALTGRCWEAAA